MIYDEVKCIYKLTSGRIFKGGYGGLSIGDWRRTADLYYGYDGTVNSDIEGEYFEFTISERQEIADYMKQRWQEWVTENKEETKEGDE